MNFYTYFDNNFLILLPETFLFIMLNILLIYGVVYNTSQYYKYPNLVKNIGWFGIQVLLISLFLTMNTIPTSITLLHKTLLHNEAIIFFKSFILIFSILCIFISFDYLKNEKINTFEYQILILISVLGSLLIISANDFLLLYLAIEIASLSLYILTAYKKTSSLSTEAGIKYIILGSFSSGLFLFGTSLIYGFTGTINFNDLIMLFFNNDQIYNGINIGIIFIFIALLFKLGAAPFHMWLPDVYEGTPTSVTIFLTIVPKIAIFGILLRLCTSVFYTLYLSWQPILYVVSIISIILGTLILINQKKIKRFLAYSSIVHMGYLLLGVSLGTIDGIHGSLLYLILYMINTINIWTIVISLEYKQKQKRIIYLSDLNSLYKNNPILAIMLSISLFSMAGIPPLAGFFSKFYLFFAAIENSSYILLFVGILTSVVSAFYYIRIIKIIYFENKKQQFYYNTLSYNNAILLSISTLLITFFIFLLNNMYDFTYFISLILMK